MSSRPSLSRRGLSRGAQQRPPWTSEQLIRDGCDSCGKCIPACPEGILIAGPAGTPVLDFSLGECTFCAVCVHACPEADTVFTDLASGPWEAQGGRIAKVGDSCLLEAGVSCQLCTDSCDSEALRMDLSHRPVGRITMDDSACVACGACVQGCPEGAITITKPAPQAEQEAVNG